MGKDVKRYSMRFRERVVERMQLEQNISALSRELGLDRSMMYIWKRKLEKRAYGNVRSGEVNPRDRQIQELQAKIAGLEGVIGRQALELDFFESALRRTRGTAQRSDDSGENTSTPKSAVEPERKAD
jgi:transposase